MFLLATKESDGGLEFGKPLLHGMFWEGSRLKIAGFSGLDFYGERSQPYSQNCECT